MAEAAVEERPPQRFYCHMCNVQFSHAASNFTCPHCSDGFIEELLDTDEASNDTNTDVEDWEDEEMEESDDLIRSILNSERRSRTRSEGGGPQRTAPGRRYANRSRTYRPRTLSRMASQNVPSFENLIQDIIINLGVDSIINLGVGGNWGATGNMQFVFGNPGDYAWGREGLDAIVTQLLNQMDSTGPPPASKAEIDQLPLSEISENQAQSKLQCSVCWEDFVAREPVKRLPCQHVYHEPCIRPWLELHATCPICRQNLGEEKRGENGSEGGNGASGSGASGAAAAANSAAILRNLFLPTTSSASRTNPSTSGTDRQRSQNDSMM